MLFRYSPATESSYEAYSATLMLSVKNVPTQYYSYGCNSTLIEKDTLYQVECRPLYGKKCCFRAFMYYVLSLA